MAKEKDCVLIKVSLDELLAAKKLPFTLYDGGGNLLYEAGERLTHRKLGSIQLQSVYRDTGALPQCDELEEHGILFLPELALRDKVALLEEEQLPTIYEVGHEQVYLESVRKFWDGLRSGFEADIALCEVICDQLVKEITTHVNQLSYLSQLRVRDEFTYSHTIDVTALSVALGLKVGLTQSEIRDLALSAILHDLGKLLIPKSIMFKPTRLTEREFNVMKLHPGIGYKIIRDELGLPEQVARPALEHQEMWGGGGYPQNLTGDEIHYFSQIVKIADVYDALTSRRPYKQAIPNNKAIKIMLSDGEKSFNMDLFEQFMDLANYQEQAQEAQAS